MSPTATITLRRGPDAQVAQGHPWVFKRAIADHKGSKDCGAVADVLTADREWIGRGLYHPSTDLAVRLYTWREDEAIDQDLFNERIDAALRLREQLGASDPTRKDTDAYRLVFSECDLLSGLVVDRYADTLSIQLRTKLLEPYLKAMLARLKRGTGAQRVLIDVSQDHATREGIDLELVASLADESGGPVSIKESGFTYEADIGRGQKTGFYLDQRINRARVGAYAQDRSVLSCYCYTGAFELHAASAGAKDILGIDASKPALNQAQRHHELNPTDVPVQYEKSDAQKALRRLAEERKQFDLIILDPPKFVVSRAQKNKGLRAYKEINQLALNILAPDGILATFSCSGLVSSEDFRDTVRKAARESGRALQIVERLSQPPDHPVLTTFPEGEYLKGLICNVC